MDFENEIINNWLDQNKMIKPKKDNTDSGNGLLYNAIGAILVGYDFNAIFLLGIIRCQIERGLYKRTPANTYGQESWDDYLGILAGCLLSGRTNEPREILWYGLKHFWFFNNTTSFNWAAFLLRFPQVFVPMVPAAFPWLKWPSLPFLWAVGKFMRLDAGDPGGVQMSWLYFYCCKKIGFEFKEYKQAVSMLPAAFLLYYDATHPFISQSKEFK